MISSASYINLCLKISFGDNCHITAMGATPTFKVRPFFTIVITVTAVIALTRGDGDDDDDNTGVCLEDMCLEG